MNKLRNAIHLAASGLLLAGSLGFVCSAGFPQTPPKSPTAKTAHSGTKTTGSTSSHGSTSGHATKSSTKKKSSSSKSSRVKMQTAPTPDRIREIQSALAKAGSYRGEPSGNWDTQSVAAMQRFQQTNGLNPTGKLDALSLQKLGLGSDTSGKGAPRLVPAPSTTATSSTGNRR